MGVDINIVVVVDTNRIVDVGVDVDRDADVDRDVDADTDMMSYRYGCCVEVDRHQGRYERRCGCGCPHQLATDVHTDLASHPDQVVVHLSISKLGGFKSLPQIPKCAGA